MDGSPQKSSSRARAPQQVGSVRPVVAERLEPRFIAGGMVALTPDELLVGGGAPVEDGLDASLFGDDEEQTDAFGSGGASADPPPLFWLDVAEPELTAEADPLSPVGDPEAGTLAGDGMTSFSGSGGCSGGTGTGGGTVTVTALTMSGVAEAQGGTIGHVSFTARATGGVGCGASPSRATANFTLGGTATSNVDYTGPLTSGTVEIPMANGYGEKSVAFTVVDDLIVEGTETMLLQPTGATADNGFSATFPSEPPPYPTSIFDNEPVLSLSASDYGSEAPDPAVPGSATPKPVKFTVILDRPASQATPVRYAVTGGSAQATQDYAPPPGTITVAGGASSATIEIVPVNDSTVEWTEDLSLTLQAGAGYTLGTTITGTEEIVDDDPVTVSAADVVTVNNDDDNGNHQPDMDESGSVTGEDDLLPLNLTFPLDVKQGARITLSASTNLASVWKDQTRSQWLLRGSTASHTWIVGTDVVPTQLWVEGVAGSAAVGDVQFAISASDATASPPPRRATASSGAANTSNVKVSINFGGADVTSKKSEVMVGQYIGTTVGVNAPVGWAVTAYQWTIEGAAGWEPIKDYVQRTRKADIVSLTPDDLDDVAISFYWINTAPLANVDLKEVKVDVTVNGVVYGRTTNFNVHRPGSNLTGTITPNDPPVNVGLHGNTLHLGIPVVGRAGITWDGEATTPAHGAGTLQFSQRVRVDRHWVNEDGTREKLVSGGQNVHDNPTPYAGVTVTLAGSETKTISENDSPSHSLTGTKSVSVNESFELYLMYKPAGDPFNVWVTLRRLDWEWKASATKDAATGAWAVTAGAVPGTPGAVIQGYNTSMLPQWEDYLGNLQVEPE